MKEKPIVLTPDPVSPGNHPPSPHTSSSPHSSPSSSPHSSQPRRPGLSRATSVVTTHVLDLPSLSPISEERRASQERSVSPLALSSSGGDQINPFVFPSNGFIKDDSGSPPIVMVAPPTDIVVTDVENEEVERENLSTRTQFKVSFLIQWNLL